MKRIVAGIAASASLLVLAAPAFARTGYPLGVVAIRSGPGTEYAVLGTLSGGQSAPILSHDGSWIKVKTPDGLVGYMPDFVTRDVYDDETAFVQVTASSLNLEKAADPDAITIGTVYQGQQYHLLEVLGQWDKVDAGSLGTGWLSADGVAQVSPPPATQTTKTPPVDKTPVQPPKLGLQKVVSPAMSTVMYDGRSSDYDVVAYLKAGSLLKYVDSVEGWFKVIDADGDTGWVNGADVYSWDQSVDFAHQAVYQVAENDWRMQYLPLRRVVPGGGGLLLRSGASRTASVIRPLAAGDEMKLLAVPGGEYVQVMVSDGTVGYVSRNWIQPVSGTPSESVRLYQSQPGVERLEITGQLAGATLSSTDSALSITLPDNAGRQAGLAIGDHDIVSMVANANSLQLQFDQPYRYQVITQDAGSLILEIRPVVSGMEQVQGNDRVTYRFWTTGAVAPEAHREGNAVVFNLPGAQLLPGATAPAALSVKQSNSGVTAQLTSSRPFAIKRGAGYFDLVIYAPGLAGKTIVIDPGHGGSETGAISLHGVPEKNINLAIALKLQKLMQAAGANVIMTRTGDVRCATPDELALIAPDDQLQFDLNCRSTTANANSADAFLSIHNNANDDPSARGTEVFWSLDNLNASQSKILANTFQGALLAELGLHDMKAQSDVYYVTKYTDAPAALAEIAFLTNPAEEKLLGESAFQQQAAQALFDAFQQYFQ